MRRSDKAGIASIQTWAKDHLPPRRPGLANLKHRIEKLEEAGCDD